MEMLYRMHEKSDKDRGRTAFREALRAFVTYLAVYLPLRALLEAGQSALEGHAPAGLVPFLYGSGLPGMLILVLAMAGGTAAVLREGRECLAAFGKTGGRPERKDPLTLVLFTAAALFGALGLNGLAGMLQAPAGSAPQAPLAFLPALAFFGFYAPLCEEFLFRGLIQGRLRQGASPGRSVFFAALFFALYHADPVQSPYALVMGCLFGAAYETYADLRICWLFHGLANIVPLALQEAGLFGLLTGPVWTGSCLCLFLTCFSLLLFRSRTGQKRP